MLESEIKKLTEQVTRLADLMEAKSGGSVPATSQPPVQQPPVQQPPVQQPPVQQPPVQQPPVQQFAPVNQQPPAQQAGPQMTVQQAQQELGAIVQKLGDPAPVQAVMKQYGAERLTDIHPDSLFALVQSCKALVAS